jgi:phage shock protein PspC (stress-responsive transcriptional regulator)
MTFIELYSHIQSYDGMKSSILGRSAYGVCSYIGDKMGVASSKVRLYFIYMSFLTLGSPIILYLFAAFWLNVRKYIRSSYNILLEK